MTRSQYKGPDAPDDPPRVHGIGEEMRQLGIMAGYVAREPTHHGEGQDRVADAAEVRAMELGNSEALTDFR